MSARAVSVLAVLGLLLAIAVRLPGIGNGPQDIHHVRQSDTSSIARNMARHGIDLLHPRIDWAGPDAGTVESELPLYNALVALGWPAQGAVPRGGYVWARLISVAAWLLGGVALALWVRRRLPGPLVPYLVLYGLSPLGIAFSRNIQPDALAVALLLVALERADAASEQPGISAAAVAAGVFGAAAIAVKGTTAFFVLLAPVLMLSRAGGAATAGASVTAAVALAPAAAWYWHAHVHLGAEGASFGVWGGEAGKWGSFGVWLDPLTWRSIAGTYVVHTATPLGVAAAAVGLGAASRERELRPFAWALGAAALSALAVTDGYRIHSYYQLPWIPFLSVVAGAGFLELAGHPKRNVALAAAAVVGLWSALAGKAFVQEATAIDYRITAAGAGLAAFVPPGEALLVVDDHPQSILYAVDRRGYHRTSASMREVLTLKALGADFVVVGEGAARRSGGLLVQLRDGERAVARTDDWILYELRGPPDPVAAPMATGGGDDDDSGGE